MTLDELARVCRNMNIAYFDWDTGKQLGTFDCHEVHYKNMGLKNFLVLGVYIRGRDQIDVIIKEVERRTWKR